MAIFLRANGECDFVWDGDPTADLTVGDTGGGWRYADTQSSDCTIVRVRSLGDGDALAAAADPLVAVSLGVVSIDGADAVIEQLPPLFIRAIAHLVVFISSGVVSLDPTDALSK